VYTKDFLSGSKSKQSIKQKRKILFVKNLQMKSPKPLCKTLHLLVM